MNVMVHYMGFFRIRKFMLRLAIIFLIHIAVVTGDESMDVFEFSLERFLFSLFFISYGLIVWTIADSFNTSIRKKQDFYKGHHASLTYLLFVTNFIFGLGISFILNLLYRYSAIQYFGLYEEWKDVSLFNPEFTMSLFTFYLMVFVADIFFSSSLKRKEDQLHMEQLKRENLKAQYLVLRSQLEPHFLFNSLSVLSSLIHTDVKLADEFILRLSKTLRYFIEKKEMALVPLQDEMSFVQDYLFLIKCRFEDEIYFDSQIETDLISACYIPPASIQLLVENAIKHNKFSAEAPLEIRILNQDNHIIVTNKINLRDDIKHTTKMGIQNLTQRFSFFKEEPVNITINESEFKVTLPVLTKADYERFNN